MKETGFDKSQKGFIGRRTMEPEDFFSSLYTEPKAAQFHLKLSVPNSMPHVMFHILVFISTET